MAASEAIVVLAPIDDVDARHCLVDATSAVYRAALELGTRPRAGPGEERLLPHSPLPRTCDFRLVPFLVNRALGATYFSYLLTTGKILICHILL